MSPVQNPQNEKINILIDLFHGLLVDKIFNYRPAKNDMSKKREGWLVGVWDG